MDSIFFYLLGLEIAVSFVVIRFRFRTAAPLEKGLSLFIGSAPGFILLALYYSLACHMYFTLGGWPESIGERGFPPWLLSHAHVAIQYFMLTIWSLMVWPIILTLCLLVPKIRKLRLFLAVYVVATALSYGLMLLAPGRFKYWWID